MPRRGDRDARGYGLDHVRVRRQWKRKIEEAGGRCHAEICLHSSRYIGPDEPWDLGHSPDRRRWTGPEHPDCNRSEGGRRSHGTRPQSRRW